MSGCHDLPSTAVSDDGMMRQTMWVVAVDEEAVLLEAERASACGSCATRQGCGTGALAELMGGRQQLVVPRTQETLMVRPGDQVVVAMPGGAFLSAAVKAYLLPPAALAAAAVIAAGTGLSDLQTALVCVPVLGLSLLPLLWAERRGRVLKDLVIERRLGPALS